MGCDNVTAIQDARMPVLFGNAAHYFVFRAKTQRNSMRANLGLVQAQIGLFPKWR